MEALPGKKGRNQEIGAFCPSHNGPEQFRQLWCPAQCSQHLAFMLVAVSAAGTLNSAFSKYKKCFVSCNADYLNLGSIYMREYIGCILYDLLYL